MWIGYLSNDEQQHENSEGSCNQGIVGFQKVSYGLEGNQRSSAMVG